MPDRVFYRRHLPHFQPDKATFHVVFRLADTLPAPLLEELRRQSSTDERPWGDELMSPNTSLARQRERFRRLQAALDAGDHGPRWLAQPAVAAIIDEALRYRDGRIFHRFASCIMPNHLHLLISLLPRDWQPTPSLTQVLHDLKGYTAWKGNELLDRGGRFWQE